MSSIKAPSIACWSLSAIFGYGAVTSNYWFTVPSLILLAFGIHFYEKESKKREEKEKIAREKEERDFWFGIGKGFLDWIDGK